MEPTRAAARILAKADKVEVVQHGVVLGVNGEYRGPIRLRLRLMKK